MKEIWQYYDRHSQRPLMAATQTRDHNQMPANCIATINWKMSPTIFRERGFRFSFFSNEEPRMHVHVFHADGTAKFWLEPDLELAENDGLKPQQIKKRWD